jgi:hypothetical protein
MVVAVVKGGWRFAVTVMTAAVAMAAVAAAVVGSRGSGGGSWPPPAILPRCRQPLPSHPYIAPAFSGSGGDKGGGMVEARSVAVAVVVLVA